MMCQQAVQSRPDVTDEALPYIIAVTDGGDEMAVALCHSSAIAYAAYYAALREHFGRGLTLRCGHRVLADTRLS